MAKFSALLPAITLAVTMHAQQQDPANLTGEHVSPPALADTLPINHGAPALQQLLLKLRTRASLMMIVAHPDDEDGGMLTFESRGAGARVAVLTLTRGEGGQNLMSADFDDALGLIRTQELLAADRYMGVDQMFGTEVDFGFSKTKEETFSKWTHDRVLYDAVRAVRLYRPLVLASVFVGGVTDGHGQHQVSGEITQEVFLAAADPTVFPEMELPPWAPLKVYARVPFSRVTSQGMYDYATGRWAPPRFHNYVTGRDITTEPSATVLIHEGGTSTIPTLNQAMNGDTFVQFARRGLALQKTQIGAGVRLAPPGAFDVGYTLMASRTACTKPECLTFSDAGRGGTVNSQPTEQTLFDGIDTTLSGIASLDPDALPSLPATLRAIEAKVAEAQRLFDPAHLEASAPPLRDALRMLDTCITRTETNTRFFNLAHELKVKRVQFNNALLLALNIHLEASSTSAAIQTDHPSIEVTTVLSNNGHRSLRLAGNAFQASAGGGMQRQGTVPGPELAPGTPFEGHNRLTFANGLTPTRPYFSRTSIEQPFYDLAHPELRNAPATPAPLIVRAWVESEGVSLDVMAELRSAPDSTHPNSVPHLVQAVPPVSVTLFPTLGLVTPAEKRLTVRADVNTAPARAIAGTLRLLTPSGWHVDPLNTTLTQPAAGRLDLTTFHLTAPSAATGSAALTAIVAINDHTYTEGFRPVGYPGLTYTNYYTPATYRVTAVDVHTAPNLHIAYLPGTGDTVPDYLPNLGITPAILTVTDLTPAKLAQYDAVLLGVRAYAAHPELSGARSKPLLDYARSGGTVIVQYNNSVYDGDSAPFPLTVPGDPAHNVVVEADPVTLLAPEHPLLTWPNTITAADFNGWTEERGHGFAATWDPRYTALTETHDPGQDPQRGGLLYTPIGKGAYIYIAYALYRQLPEGVPGAYRLLANLLSLGKNPALKR